MLIVRREPAAKASFVAKSDRRRLGTTIPAMNKVNATSMSSRASEKAFCVFMVFAFTPKTAFSKNPVRGKHSLGRPNNEKANPRNRTGEIPTGETRKQVSADLHHPIDTQAIQS